ncbi:unnamed protein product [Adineta steineri]|uniref:Uncharacterized protein n=1 Tax=Adineta steineri TaxID=433720 RepID=A0A813WM90_9BILA|nr:unnamed protein product [Adineta steineri]
MAQSRKQFVEQFIDTLTNPKTNDLKRFLEEDVQKTVNSKVVYSNIEEAKEYYTKEQDGKTTSQWTIVECEPEDPKTNTLRLRISHGNKTSDTLYTFSSNDKVQRIDAVN